jgi:tetratricopeptide (TPR) repeat protein
VSTDWPASFKLKAEALQLAFDDQREDALAKYETLAKLYPDDPDAQYRLGDLASEMGRFDKASLALRKCMDLSPSNPSCQFEWMQLMVRTNQFEAGIATYDTIRGSSLNYPWLDKLVGYAYIGKGDLVAAQNRFENLARASRKLHGRVHFATAKDGLADVNLYQGKVRSATVQIEQAMETCESGTERANYLLFLASVQTLIGNKGNAASLARRATKESTDPLTFISAARLFAMNGDKAAAIQALAPKMPDGKPLGPIGPVTKAFIEGSLALAESNAPRAIDRLRDSYELDKEEDLDTEYMLARAYMSARQWDDAMAPLTRIVSSKGRVLLDGVPLLWPLAHYYLGRCHEERRGQKEAIGYYSQFLEIWKAADLVLPQLADAKTRLARLQAPH